MKRRTVYTLVKDDEQFTFMRPASDYYRSNGLIVVYEDAHGLVDMRVRTLPELRKEFYKEFAEIMSHFNIEVVG